MTALPNKSLWHLIDSVRDRSYDLFTIEEKRRMHDLVVSFKESGRVSFDDVAWLKDCDSNLRGMGISPANPAWRSRRKARALHE